MRRNRTAAPSSFEVAVVREAHSRNCEGVICGHIHTPDDRMIDGIHYLNDGDWVESCTALVEHHDGRFEILDWKKHPAAKLNWSEDADIDRNGRLATAS